VAKLKLAISWFIVAVPLAWGIWNTLQNAMKLFE